MRESDSDLDGIDFARQSAGRNPERRGNGSCAKIVDGQGIDYARKRADELRIGNLRANLGFRAVLRQIEAANWN